MNTILWASCMALLCISLIAVDSYPEHANNNMHIPGLANHVTLTMHIPESHIQHISVGEIADHSKLIIYVSHGTPNVYVQTMDKHSGIYIEYPKRTLIGALLVTAGIGGFIFGTYWK